MSLYAALTKDYVNEQWRENVADLYETVAFRNVIGADKRLQTSGVAFARKAHNGPLLAKSKARERILKSLSRDEFPGQITMLTLPGLEWLFESQLINQRDYKINRFRLNVKLKSADVSRLDNYIILLAEKLKAQKLSFAGPIPMPTKHGSTLNPYRRFLTIFNPPDDFEFDCPSGVTVKPKGAFERRGFVGSDQRTKLYSVERDPAIYFAALKYIPGARSGYNQMSAHAMQTSKVDLYYFTDVETFVQHPECPEVDAAWLDFTGYMVPWRLSRLRRFWREKCHKQLAITILNARYPSHVKAEVQRHSSMAKWIVNTLGGELYDEFHYFDDYSAMLQIILRKDSNE